MELTRFESPPDAASALVTAAVTDVAHRIAFASDCLPVDAWAELLTDNVVIDLFGDVNEGKAANVAGSSARRSTGRSGPGSGTRHLVTTVVVDVSSDDGADAVVTALFVRTEPTLEVTRVVTYQDSYRREGSRWYLARRTAR